MVQAISSLVKLQPALIRGNASEIMATAGAGAQTRGVDSSETVDAAEAAAKRLALEAGCVVAVSGATDLVGPAPALACPPLVPCCCLLACSDLSTGVRTGWVPSLVGRVPVLGAGH